MQWLQPVVGGLAQGCVYGLVALGFVLIYKATEAVSFAQGELMMLGAFAALVAMEVLAFPYWIAVPAAVAATVVVGVGIERVAVRPILGQPTFAIVMVTIGVGYVVRGLVTMIPGIGTDTHLLRTPYHGETWSIGGAVVDVAQLVVMAATGALCVASWLFFRSTRIGIAMQAASQNQLAAGYVGVPVQRLNGLVWGLAAAVAAVAGILLAPVTFVHAGLGLIGLKALPAAVVGGFGSLPGAVVGGLAVGLTESLAGYWLPDGSRDVAPYLLVLAVLAVRPEGLFGESTRKKV